MKYFAAFLLIVLLVLHQDYWQWQRSDVVFGFIPYPLAWHMGVSIATALAWLFIVSFAWPVPPPVPPESDSTPCQNDSNEGQTPA